MAETEAASPRSKGRPTLEEAGEIDRVIREAAMNVLREHGEAATVNAVAKAAGLSRKSLYARYPTKTDLFVAAIGDVLMAVVPLSFSRGASFEESLRNYILAGLRSIITPGSQAIQRLILFNPDYLATLRPAMSAAMRTTFIDPLFQLLADAKASGEIVIDDIELTVQGVVKLIVVQDIAPDKVRNFGHAQMNTMAEFLTGLICRGLLPR